MKRDLWQTGCNQDSFYLHLNRAYFQIQDWQGNALELTEYGWEIKDGLLEPIPMQQDPVPVLGWKA